MNPNYKLIDYLHNPDGQYFYLSIDNDYIHWMTRKYTDLTVQTIKFCESIGNPCIISFPNPVDSIRALHPVSTILYEDNENIEKEISLISPIGNKSWVLKQKKSSVVERLSEASQVPVKEKDDFVLFEWFYQVVKQMDWSEFIKGTREIVMNYKGKTIPCIFLPPPSELLYWVKREDMFYLFYDYQKEYLEAVDNIINAYGIIMDVIKSSGITMIMYGAPGGTEFTSPSFWEQLIVPSSSRMENMMRERRIFSIFHCCGKIDRIIRNGFINQIAPSIYETFSTPPVGDVENLKELRSITDASIITHGNIDLTFLRDSAPEQIIKKGLQILDETKGFPHLVGTGDSCILPGTPAENLIAICSIFNA